MTMISQEQEERIRDRIRQLAVPKEPIPTELAPKTYVFPGLKAVYVDVYGTILISGTEPMMRRNKERILMLLRQSFRYFDLPEEDVILEKALRSLNEVIEEAHSRMKSQGIDHPEVDIIRVWEKVLERVFGNLTPGDLHEDQVPDLLTDFVTRYDEPWLMPGLTHLVDGLREKGIRTGIISNSQFYTPLTLEALSGKSMAELGFASDDCFWSFEENIAKPSVRFYEIAASHLQTTYHISPEEVLFVGNDMLNDVWPAAQAGFKTALFAGDARSLRLRKEDERCKTLSADVIATDLLQILNVLA